VAAIALTHLLASHLKETIAVAQDIAAAMRMVTVYFVLLASPLALALALSTSSTQWHDLLVHHYMANLHMRPPCPVASEERQVSMRAIHLSAIAGPIALDSASVACIG
jgi:hypothetical protein